MRPATLLDQLNRLEGSGLIHRVQIEPELEYPFRHALVHEAAYASMLKEDRLRRVAAAHCRAWAFRGGPAPRVPPPGAGGPRTPAQRHF